MKRRKSSGKRRTVRRQPRGFWAQVWSMLRAEIRKSTRGILEPIKMGLLWLGVFAAFYILLAWR